ncbi:hypothetical protein [Streptomyces sp. NPDC005573]|uniref:hypothetical protein n=1 Tax=unclassified Streptomyces TaxID=2593676 RepID=UPI0033B6C6A4
MSLLLPAAFLGGCSVFGGLSCEDKEADAELARLAADPLFDAAPARATAPADHRDAGVTTECDDDSSGPAWLHADRVYAFPGRPEDVLAHYAQKAAPAGWRARRDPYPDAPPPSVDGACWTRTTRGRHLMFQIGFDTRGFVSAPRAGNGVVYVVTVGTEADSDTACWD